MSLLKNLWRSLTRRRAFTTINVLGLTVGLAACILIFLYARNELTWDRFHEHAGDTYLILKERHLPTGIQELDDTWIPMKDALLAEYPEIVNATRVLDRERPLIVGEQAFERTVIWADPSFFEIFGFDVAGPMRGEDLLANRESILVSRQTALDLFGDREAVGEVVRLEDKDYIVAGILETYPVNSSLALDAVASFDAYIDPADEEAQANWGSSFLYTFVQLRPGADPKALETKLEEFIETRFGTEGPNGRGNMFFRLLALPDWYEWRANTRTLALSLLVIAAIILVIAIVNFTNLSTAASLRRSREIGMRKVLGAGRPRLMRQFLGESVFLAVLALLLAVGVVEVVRPWMNGYFAIDLRLPLLDDWRIPASLLAFGVTVGLLAGAYPALVLSAYRPSVTIKGERTPGRSRGRIRNTLIGMQFVLAIALLALTAIVWQQIQFMKDHNLNLDAESVVAIEYSMESFEDGDAAAARLESAKQEIAKLPGVLGASISSGVLGDYVGANVFARPVDYDDDVPFRIQIAGVDVDYFDLYRMPLLAGSAFTPEQITAYADVVILNETCARMMGLLEGGIGTQVIAGGQRELVGILADHHFAPLTEEIRPIAYVPAGADSRFGRYLSVRLAPGDVAASLARVREVWSGFDSSGAFAFTFVDDRFRELYASQERVITLAGIFSLIGVLIASLGLLGLVSYAVVLRTKEIGIRKVLGANARHILTLIGRDYLGPVLLANLIAWPAAWWLGSLYLREFPYRMTLNAETFLFASLLAFALAAVTLAVTVLRAATSKPSESLRHE